MPGDTTGGEDQDLFVHDRHNGTTRRVSIGLGGAEANGTSFDPALSADGRFVVFNSGASNLVPGDTNGTNDVFLHDLQTGATRRVSRGLGGAEADGASFEPAISADGRIVAFTSFASNLVLGDTGIASDVFVSDSHTGRIRRVSVGPGGIEGNSTSAQPSISADGRVVAFSSRASNLVPATDTNELFDVFVRLLARPSRIARRPRGRSGFRPLAA